MSIPSWAVRGAKVVCISQFKTGKSDESIPVVGSVYTIRAVVVIGAEYGFHLEEIRNPEKPTIVGRMERIFHPSRFRPVVSKTQEQDLATHFEQYLKTDHRAPEKADA